MPFSPETRNRVLLWCDRHCCVCKKQCGVNIEVDHIKLESAGGSNDIDNALPLCFECHSLVKHYNPEHPRGTKYKEEELKLRRDQVYEEFTRHLVPPLHYKITNLVRGGKRRKLPDVGFEISHSGNSLPVRVAVDVDIRHEGCSLGPPKNNFYKGKRLWHLNPRVEQIGHFDLPEEVVKKGKIELAVSITIHDIYDREHQWLPVGFEYMRPSAVGQQGSGQVAKEDTGYWALVPSPEAHPARNRTSASSSGSALSIE